ncbi:bidirectional sugar transporter SWEET4-like [Chenopodium quinoa]|uniref:bidirectional sugar transporter SWEET4-like n=1 Tax=Chenopodium quinoa TaxID=63459 RepID=UPI000B783C27|nr:bidirectional sugar transporter SWEET4-like [Chenopodium quinoa]
MISPSAIRFAAGIIGNITALFLFLSPLPTFIGIYKKKTVGQYSSVPYLATFVNCMLWVVYGLPFIHPNSILVVTINGAGFFIELIYLILFVIYSDKKNKLKIVLIAIVEIIIVGIMTALVLILTHTTKRRSSIVGMIAIVCNIMMYASPLSVMKLVITTKSVEYMPFSLSIASFTNGIAWTVYALFPLDPYIAAPNGLGTIFALVQLILYATYYKSTKEQIAARKLKSTVGLTEVIYNEDSAKPAQFPHNGRAQKP